MAFNSGVDQGTSLAIGRGQLKNCSSHSVTGRLPTGSTSFQTIWNNGGIYAYPTAATTAVVTSSDAASDDTGTVTIVGLDENYDIATEVATIGGAATTTTFIRVNDMCMTTANTGTANVGVITCTVNVLPVSVIEAGLNRALQAVYTVPNGYVQYMLSANIGVSKQKEVEGQIVYRPTGEPLFRMAGYATQLGGNLHRDFHNLTPFPEKTDIELRVKVDAVAVLTGGFECLLEFKG